MKTTQMSTDRWMDEKLCETQAGRQTDTHTHTPVSLQTEFLQFATTGMGLKDMVLSEVSHRSTNTARFHEIQYVKREGSQTHKMERRWSEGEGTT